MSIYCYTVGDIITSHQMRVNSLSGFRDFCFIGIARTLRIKLGHVGVLVHSKSMAFLHALYHGGGGLIKAP